MPNCTCSPATKEATKEIAKDVDLADGKYRSRKFWLTIVALALIVGVAMVSAFFAPIQAVYATMVSGVLGVCALYFGGNVAAKHVLHKTYGESTH
jgi:hypothetical protein